MSILDKFLKKFPIFTASYYETRFDIAKAISWYNDQYILNYSQIDILNMTNDYIERYINNYIEDSRTNLEKFKLDQEKK